MVSELLPLRFGPAGTPLFFRLFGLLFAVVGALNVLRPREMAAWQVRHGYGEVDGRIEPSDTRVLLMRVFGGFFLVVGLGIFLGLFP